MPTPSPIDVQEIEKKIVDILGLETAPDGTPNMLLERDADDVLLGGTNFQDEVKQLVSLLSQATEKAYHDGRAEEAIGCYDHCEKAVLEERKRASDQIKKRRWPQHEVFNNGSLYYENKGLDTALDIINNPPTTNGC